MKVGSITLRTAQVNLINKFDESIRKRIYKMLFLAPTGLGKTFGIFSCALRFIENYEKVNKKRGRIVILIPTEDLMKQHKRDFLKLCENRSIGFLYNGQKDFEQDVIIANVKTLKNYLHKFKKNEFQVIIVDETQYIVAYTWDTILNYFKDFLLLGMTATPNRTDWKDIYGRYDNNIILEYTEKECFENGWLRPYDLLTLWDPWCDYNNIKGYYGKDRIFKYNMNDLAKKYVVPERIQGIINTLKKGCDKHLKRPNGEKFIFKGIGNRRGIYFLPRVDVVKRYCKEFNKAGIKSTYIVGKTSSKKREQIFKDFEEGKYQFIFNVNVVKEGLHPKGVDLVIIDRPTDSHILWVQAKGRQLFNIEGEDYDRKGLVIDLAGNSKNSFRKHLRGSKGTCKGEKIHELIEKEIGVRCFFQPEFIDYLEEVRKDNKEFSKKEIVEEFQRLEKELGRGLISTDFCYKNKKSKFSMKVIENNFGTWNNFLRDMGIPTSREERENRYPKKDLINIYEELKKRGVKITQNNFLKRTKTSKKVFDKDFGSWNGFLRYFGEFPNRDIKDKDIIKDYKNVKLKLGYVPSQKEFDKFSNYSHGIYDRFGGYGNFLKKVGDYKNHPYLKGKLETKNKIIQDYLNLSNYGKEYIPFHEFSKKTGHNQTRIEKFFLGYKNLLKECNSDIAHRPKRTDLVDDYRIIKEKLGRIPTGKDIKKYSKYSYNLYLKKFNKRYNNFLKYVGDFEDYLKKRKEISIIQLNKINNKTNNLKIAKFKPLITIPPTKIKRKGMKKTYDGLNTHGYQDRTTNEKDEIRPKIVKQIMDNDNVIALENEELSFIKELEKQRKKPKKVSIPNNKESVKLVNALINHGYKIQTNKNGIVELTKNNSFPVTVINTDARTWLINTQEKPDFLWLDYCGAFSFYAKDLDVVFGKHFEKMKLVLTYNLFDPAKDDENYYFTRVIDYVLSKNVGREVRLINDISYRYKKNMYNIGFNICKIKGRLK